MCYELLVFNKQPAFIRARVHARAHTHTHSAVSSQLYFIRNTHKAISLSIYIYIIDASCKIHIPLNIAHFL